MPAEVADAEEEVPADAEDNAEEKKEPQSEVDEHGRDVFEGYNFGETAYEASVIESIEEEGAAAIPSEKLVDSAEKHSANVSQASLPNTHLQPESQQPEEDTLSNSDRSSSTRITHMDKDIYTSHSTDPSTTTTSDARRRDPSAEVESVKGDHSMQSSETKTDTIPDILEESHDEDGDWDVVEQEDQTAQNGRRVNGRRGIGKTLFQKGVHDRCESLPSSYTHKVAHRGLLDVLAVVDAVRPTPKRRSSVRAKTPTMTRSMSSRSSSLDESSGADSPGQSRRKVFKLPRNTSSNHIAPNSSGSRTPIKKMRFKMSRTQLKTPKATSSQISLDSVGTPTSDRTAELSPVQWTPSDASQADKVVSTRALNPILGAMKRAT